MEHILHAEPILRQCPAPLSIGHTSHMFYGKKLNSDGEDVGDIHHHIQLGSPLHSLDTGQTDTSIPLVKTVEYIPDVSDKSSHIFSETTYFQTHDKHLIPFRSKVMTGDYQGLRLNHIPSLNMARRTLTGNPIDNVGDSRVEIVRSANESLDTFKNKSNQSLKEWIENDLLTTLDTSTVSTLSFDEDVVQSFYNRYVDQIYKTPHYFSQNDLKRIAGTVYPLVEGARKFNSSTFQSESPLSFDLRQMKSALVPNNFDFRSFGTIPVRKLNRILYNHKEFQDICELFDTIPLTDFNIDLVMDTDNEIVFYHEHLCLNRFLAVNSQIFDIKEEPIFGTVFRDYFHSGILTFILEKVTKFHPDLSQEMRDRIDFCSVKFKFIKTFSDEAAVLLYAHDSEPNDPPFCGLYFDIAVQSLSPMSIVPLFEH